MTIKTSYYPLIAVLLSVVSGLLLAFALPPRDANALGWFAFAPLLWASRITRPLIAAGCGILAAIACGWVAGGHVTTTLEYANLIAAFGGLALLLAFAAGVSSFGAGKMSPIRWLFLVACAGVTAEILFAHVFPASVAISQYRNPLALRLAPYTGIWGVTFLLWFAAASVVVSGGRPRTIWPAAADGLIIIASFVLPMPSEHKEPEVTVGVVQAMDRFSADEISKKLAGRARIVVWPEEVLSADDKIPLISARQNKLYIVASFAQESSSGKHLNTAWLISPEGKKLASSAKIHLFGQERFDYESGKHIHPVQMGKIPVGTPICFDTEYTDITRNLVRHGAKLILVPNSDPEMPNSAFNYLHSAVIPFRAAENGVPIAWSEENGLSSIFDSHGRRVACVPVSSKGCALHSVALRSHITPFTRWGDYFGYLCAMVVAAILFHSAAIAPRNEHKSAA